MDDQKRQSGARTPGLANPTNPAAAEAKIPLVIVSQPTEAEIVPAELIGIAVDYDPVAVSPRPGSSNGNDVGDGVVGAESNGTGLSEVATVTEPAKSQASEFGWFSATPPAASPILTPPKVKIDTNLSVAHRTRTGNTPPVINDDMSLADSSDDSLQPPTVRRGPTIRHDRLQHSETMASTRMAMDPMDQQRQLFEYRMTIRKGQVAIAYSSLLLFFSSVAFGCLATTEILHLVGAIPNLEQSVGITAGALFSGITAIVAAFLTYYTFKKHRKNREHPDDARNSWIELQHREKPLPPLPSLEKSAADEKDPKVRAARSKFVEDPDRLFRYLWNLEDMLLRAHGGDRDAIPEFMVIHDILDPPEPQSTSIDVVVAESSTPVRRRNRFSPIRLFSSSNGRNEPDQEASSTPKAGSSTQVAKKATPKHAAQDSFSKDVLLTTTESVEAAVPRSETTTSILGELCDAVTEHYSPLNRVIVDATTSRRSSCEKSPATGNSSTGQRRWSHRGYTNLTDVPETEPDPYDTENYRRKGKGRAK